MVIASLVVAALAQVGGAQTYEGDAYARRGDALLYREQHWIWRDGDRERRVVVYRCPDGAAFARKNVETTRAPNAPDFELVDARLPYREGTHSAGERREVFVERDGRRASTVLTPPADAVIDAGFDRYLQQQWDALRRGAQPVIPFLVPSERRFLPFRVRWLADDAAHGETRFRLAVAAWYGFLAPNIDVAYDTTTRALRRYVGLSNIRDAGGDNVDVRIEFPRDRARDGVDAREIDAANAAALSGRCDLR